MAAPALLSAANSSADEEASCRTERSCGKARLEKDRLEVAQGGASPPDSGNTDLGRHQIPETVVRGERLPASPVFGPGGVFSNVVEGPFLPDVEGTQIFDGKKTVDIDLETRPPIVDYNFRQVLLKAPGLFYNEESTGLTGIGYRGLNPDRSQFMQILEDGFPLGANIMGFNESYYLPPLQLVDRIEFTHGGSALLYGPQPGGALNFITRDPITDRPFLVYSQNAFGSHNLVSTFDGLSGTVGPVGYNLYGLYRRSDGFRDFNSDQDVDYAGGKVITNLSATSRLITQGNYYHEHHGEPGRLTRETVEADPNTATRRFDYFKLDRDFGGLTYQQAFTDATFLQFKFWGDYFSRFSRRQRGGGFGTVPTGTQSDFRLEDFLVFGVEPRLRYDYELIGEQPSMLTAGILYYYNDGERHDSRGPVNGGGTRGNEARTSADRTTNYASFFAENRFAWDRLSVTVGMRLENIWQEVRETFNVAKMEQSLALGHHDDHDFVPLFGGGITYELAPRTEVYTNVSQSYRPKLFQETVSPGPNEIVAGDIDPGAAWQMDVGFRAVPAPYWDIDTSIFYLEFNDQIGTVANVIDNVGDSHTWGWEFATDVDLVGVSDAIRRTDWVNRFGSLAFFYNHTVLNADFTDGPNKGKTPAYAAKYIFRGGLGYTYYQPLNFLGDFEKLNGLGGYDRSAPIDILFTGTFVGKHHADDANTPDFQVPSYKIWDLTGEVKVYKEILSVFGGVYNLFDEQYFAFIRGDGIEPADGRNYFGGFKLSF